MNYFRALIVHNEENSTALLQQLLRELYPEITIVGTSGVENSLPSVELLKPALIFIDVEDSCPKEMIVQFLQLSDCKIIVLGKNKPTGSIFTDKAQVQYLPKPIHPQLLHEVLKVFFNNQSRSPKNGFWAEQKATKILLPSTEGYSVIHLSEIIRIQSDNSYTSVYTFSNQYTLSKSIKDFENLLREDQFIRVHNSHLINLNHMKAFLHEDGGTILMMNGDRIPVSKRKLMYFKSSLKTFFTHF